VAEALCKNHPVPIEFVGILDTFTETSLNYEELLGHYGLRVKDIVDATKCVMQKKKTFHVTQ